MPCMDDFLRKYPQIVVTGPISIAHIMETWKTDFQAKDMPLASFTPHTIQMQRQNAYYYAQDEQMNLPLEEVNIKVVRIPVTSQTRKYTQKDFTPWFVNNTKDRHGIYVAYEETSNYFYCNSGMLHLEITIARGIPAAAIQNKTEKYREYVSLIQRYITDYSDFQI